jgi:hypothetical protein
VATNYFADPRPGSRRELTNACAVLAVQGSLRTSRSTSNTTRRIWRRYPKSFRLGRFRVVAIVRDPVAVLPSYTRRHPTGTGTGLLNRHRFHHGLRVNWDAVVILMDDGVISSRRRVTSLPRRISASASSSRGGSLYAGYG